MRSLPIVYDYHAHLQGSLVSWSGWSMKYEKWYCYHCCAMWPQNSPVEDCKGEHIHDQRDPFLQLSIWQSCHAQLHERGWNAKAFLDHRPEQVPPLLLQATFLASGCAGVSKVKRHKKISASDSWDTFQNTALNTVLFCHFHIHELKLLDVTWHALDKIVSTLAGTIE